MHSSRRLFIKNTAIAMAGTTMLPSFLLNEQKKKELVGIQLYSIRADMLKDAAGTLKQLAAMGYKYVEHANYIDRKFYGYSPVEFKKLLDGLGLKMRSGHTVMTPAHWDIAKKDFTDAWKYTVEDAATVGQQLVISPWLDNKYRSSYDELKAFNGCV